MSPDLVMCGSRTPHTFVGVKRWGIGVGAAAAMYAGTAFLSLLIAFDNFDGYGGVRVGDEVMFLVLGIAAVSALAAAVLWRRGRLTPSGVTAAVGVPLLAIVVSSVLLDHYVHRHVPGASTVASTQRLLDYALLAVATAPLVAAAVAARRSRASALVLATTISAIGWLVLLTVTALRLR